MACQGHAGGERYGGGVLVLALTAMLDLQDRTGGTSPPLAAEMTDDMVRNPLLLRVFTPADLCPARLVGAAGESGTTPQEIREYVRGGSACPGAQR